MWLYFGETPWAAFCDISLRGFCWWKEGSSIYMWTESRFVLHLKVTFVNSVKESPQFGSYISFRHKRVSCDFWWWSHGTNVWSAFRDFRSNFAPNKKLWSLQDFIHDFEAFVLLCKCRFSTNALKFFLTFLTGWPNPLPLFKNLPLGTIGPKKWTVTYVLSKTCIAGTLNCTN